LKKFAHLRTCNQSESSIQQLCKVKVGLTKTAARRQVKECISCMFSVYALI